MRGAPIREVQRLALISSPRSGNTWLRRMLAALFGLDERAAHAPSEVGWDELPPRSILQLHWPMTQSFTEDLRRHGFHVIVLTRHPLDVLISILHFAAYEPATSRWLGGAHGDESSIERAEPCSPEFLDYAHSLRARALLGVSDEWSTRADAVAVRYEDLVTDPIGELQRIVECERTIPVGTVEEAVQSVSFGGMQKESDNHHFWQGQPGLWRRLLTSDYAEVASIPYREQAMRHGYEFDGNPDLGREDAAREWAILSKANTNDSKSARG
jgi:hypothetical protein